MLFIDGPAASPHPEVWQAYLERLNKLNPHDPTVVREKAHAKRILQMLAEEPEFDVLTPPSPP